MTSISDAYIAFSRRNCFMETRELKSEGSVPLVSNIYPYHVEVELSKGVTKILSLEDFKELFLNCIDDKTQTISKDLILPNGCFHVNMQEGDITLMCYYPGTKTTIKYQPRSDAGIQEFTIPLPNMVITYTLTETSPEDSTSYTIQGDVIYKITDKTLDQLVSLPFDNLEDHLKMVPFTNFYESGRMCFGRNIMPMRFTKNLRGLDYYYKVISLSPFNEDLGVKGMRASYSAATLFHHLSTKEVFPYEDMR